MHNSMQSQEELPLLCGTRATGRDLQVDCILKLVDAKVRGHFVKLKALGGVCQMTTQSGSWQMQLKRSTPTSCADL